MDDFRIIYKILKTLQESMDYESFENTQIEPEELHISEPKWSRIMAMLVNEGYVTGIQVWNSMSQSYPRVKVMRPELTLKGLEYLEDNTFMKRAANLAKGIKDTIPGL